MDAIRADVFSAVPSGAIVDYLVEKYGKGKFTPRSRQAQLDNTFFMHYAEGSFMPPLVLKVVFNTILEKSPFLVRPFTSMVTSQIGGSFIDPALASNFALVDEYLRKDGGRRFLAGGSEPTGGDFMVSWRGQPEAAACQAVRAKWATCVFQVF